MKTNEIKELIREKIGNYLPVIRKISARQYEEYGINYVYVDVELKPYERVIEKIEHTVKQLEDELGLPVVVKVHGKLGAMPVDNVGITYLGDFDEVLEIEEEEE